MLHPCCYCEKDKVMLMAINSTESRLQKIVTNIRIPKLMKLLKTVTKINAILP